MSDQNRRVRSDWAQFEAAGRDLEGRARALDLEREHLAAEIEPIELAIEGGLPEYKRGRLNEAFRILADARYRSLTSAQILDVARSFGLFAYVVTIQRLIADGTLRVREHPPRDRHEGSDENDAPIVAEAPPEPQSEIDVKQIIAEIQELVQNDPDARMRQPVKNILMQLSRYRRELEQVKEITARTTPDKRAPIAENFKKTSGEIFASIRRNYEQLGLAEREAVHVEPQNVLLRVAIKELVPLLNRQVRAAMEIRSSLLHAREEQYGTRETLLALADRRDATLALVAEEEKLYGRIAGTERLVRHVARSFALEVARRVERETEVY